jgi:hypothetical protein
MMITIAITTVIRFPGSAQASPRSIHLLGTPRAPSRPGSAASTRSLAQAGRPSVRGEAGLLAAVHSGVGLCVWRDPLILVRCGAR